MTFNYNSVYLYKYIYIYIYTVNGVYLTGGPKRQPNRLHLHYTR